MNLGNDCEDEEVRAEGDPCPPHGLLSKISLNIVAVDQECLNIMTLGTPSHFASQKGNGV